ncbi:alpha-2,3-sialyltransferase, partial [Campylobacter lari]
QDNLTKIQLSNDQLLFCAKYGTAKSRIKNQLSYKLGQAMIINSKTFLGYLIMPIVLLSIVVSHKQEQKIYKQKIKKDSSLILPSLEQYPDYKESIELKNHLSYKLGRALIKASKTWHKGGFIYFLAKINKIKVRIE